MYITFVTIINNDDCVVGEVTQAETHLQQQKQTQDGQHNVMKLSESGTANA